MTIALTATCAGVTPAVSASAASPAPSAIGLQAHDVVGFSPQDPANITIRDPNDQGTDQAFIQCAGGVALLSQFDTGPEATESIVYGQGQTPAGTPALAAATAVFTDGQPSDAFSAYQVLASPRFQQCWASTMDRLDEQQGIVAPTSPTTLTALSVPSYGDDSTGFAMNVHYSLFGARVTGQYGFSIFRQGAVVAMLITISYGESFPDPLRLQVFADIAERAGAHLEVRAPIGPRSGGPLSDCEAPDPTIATPLLSTEQVNYTVLSSPFVFDGWSDTPNTDPQQRVCRWTSAPTTVYLEMSAPFGVGQAAQQFQRDLQLWQPTTSVPNLGNGAFWRPDTDGVQGLEVGTANRVFAVSMQGALATLTRHEQDEITLARLVIQALGDQTGPVPNPIPITRGPGKPSPTVGGGQDDPNCGVNVSLGVSNAFTKQLDADANRAASRLLPVSAAEVTFPAGSWLSLAPALVPGSFKFCSTPLVHADLAHTPPFEDPASTMQVDASAETSYGTLTYSSELASWTQLSSATPPDQDFETKFDPELEVPETLNVDIGKAGMNASLVLARLIIASDDMSLQLVSDHGALFTVSMGPELSLDLDVTKRDVVDEIAKELKQGEGEKVAEEDISEQVAGDEAAAVEGDTEGYYSMSPAEVRALVSKLDAQVGPQLLRSFEQWFASLKAGSPDVTELEDQGVTANDVSPADAAAFEDDAGGSILTKLGCTWLFGGPEDPIGDVVCDAS